MTMVEQIEQTQEPKVPTKKELRALRNEKIAQCVVDDGLSLEAVGKEFDLTRERVRQIAMEVRPEFDLTARRAEERDMRTQARREERETARAERRALLRSGASNDAEDAPRKYDDETMLENLRIFAKEYPKMRAADWAGLPSVMTYVRRFGSWRGALAAAGMDVPVYTGKKRGPKTEWTDEACLHGLHAFLQTTDIEPNENFGVAHYERWRANRPGMAPSRSLLLVRFGSWRKAKQRALEMFGDA
jgi:hypothetical protein